MNRKSHQVIGLIALGIIVGLLSSDVLRLAHGTQGSIPAYSSLKTWDDANATASTLVARDASGNDIAGVRTATGGIVDQGYLALPVSTVTGSTYSMTGNEGVILGNATSNVVAISLPVASTAGGRTYFVVKTDSSGNAVTVGRSGSDTINGSTSAISLGSQWSDGSFVSDGVSNWIKK
jgi:hypothetical protein